MRNIFVSCDNSVDFNKFVANLEAHGLQVHNRISLVNSVEGTCTQEDMERIDQIKEVSTLNIIR